LRFFISINLNNDSKENYYLLLLVVLLSAPPLFGQEKFTLSGTIIDANSNETLIGVNVVIPELKTGVTTNEYIPLRYTKRKLYRSNKLFGLSDYFRINISQPKYKNNLIYQ
jgi:hypothetical protein